MINIKEMSNLELDEASARILGYKGQARKDGFYYIERRKVKGMLKKWNPTGDITQGWSIIVNNHIDILAPRPYVDHLWQCQIIGKVVGEKMIWSKGPDSLVEAIRVFIMANVDKLENKND